jgi:hypothetical protein
MSGVPNVIRRLELVTSVGLCVRGVAFHHMQGCSGSPDSRSSRCVELSGCSGSGGQ